MTMMTPPPPLDQEDDEMLVPHTDFAVEGPQPMEVVPQSESASTAENQAAEDPQTLRFTWTIENFSRLNVKKHYSDVFTVGGYKWRVLIFPKGNNVDNLSMYLDVADSTTLPYGWSRYAQFSLAIVNQVHNKYTIRKDTQHQFNARESDWGFTSFMPLSELYDPSRGYLVSDTCVVEAEVAVRRVVDYWAYDSKKETGYVGLKNQGATCYMNSLLQTLYHIPYFRKAVYHMPTTENDMPSGSIPLALQSLFYKLQYSDSSVATKELTKSFGWDTYDSFMQHDVQELNRVLCEKLEDKMKGTVVEGTIQQLFEGHHMNYIECINVDYKSTRKESFYDLQLDVKGCRDVYASFDKYVEVERLEGDNKYHAEQHGLQDAKKGVLFIDFPPVLQLQLKRFEYDFMRDTMVKINDRYEFPLQLDLDRENGKYLSPDADRRVRNLYTLHSVLVHSGGVHGGHYYAFIRPTLSDQWFKFDDERVTKEDMKRALDEQYGGEEELPQTNPGFNNTPFKFTKYSNAYMLVYIRESDKEKIICNVDEKDIAEHLRIRLKREQEEKEHKKKEKAEAHLYTIIKVARNEDLAEQIGRDIYFDLVDHDKVRSFRIQKQTPFNLFKEEVAKEFGVPVQFQRFWLWAKRQNHTYRPNRPLSHQEEAQSVGQLREVSNKANNAELKLFVEVELGLDLRPLPPPDKTKEDVLLFFKFYDPEKEELRYVGRLFVRGGGKPLEILTKMNEMAGFPPNEEIELYEEIKFEPSVMCEHIDKKLTFRASQLEDGDIVCFQKSLPAEYASCCRYPDVPSFLEYVHNRQIVHFRSLEKPKEDDFCLELSKLFNYDQVVDRVARQLGLDDPTKIRLTSHNCYSQQPKPQPIKYRGVEHLSDMLVHYNQTSDILYYEVLDIPLPELQGLKTLKVAFHHATKDEVSIHSIRLPKQSTVGDVINELKTKVELSHPNAELRLLEVFYHKIYKIFPLNEKIENINDQYWTLRAEEIPEEEKNLGSQDRLIHVYHFTKDTTQNQMQVQNFGEPFFLIIHEGETLSEVRVRIQKKLQVPDDEFSKCLCENSVMASHNDDVDIDIEVLGSNTPVSNDNAFNSTTGDCSIATSVKPKKGGYPLKSHVWQHFTRDPKTKGDDLMAICKYCYGRYKAASKSGTSTLSRHLTRCTAYSVKDKSQKVLTFGSVKKEDGNEGVRAGLVPYSFNMEHAQRELAIMIVMLELPFSIVDRAPFRRFVKCINPRFQFISCTTVRREFLKIYHLEKAKLKSFLSTSCKHISLTSDLWTSNQTLGYLSVTAHFVDNNWKLHKKILSFCMVPAPHTGVIIANMIERSLMEYDIKKICTITLDNATNNKSAVDNLVETLSRKGILLQRGKFFHIKCAAHVVNLIVQDGLSEIKSSVEAIRTCVKYVRSSQSHKQEFESCVLQENISSSKGLCLDVCTRWNSTYLMLASALPYESAFVRMKTRDPIYAKDVAPTFDDWRKAETISKLLKVFYNATKVLSGTKYITANLVFHEVYEIQAHLLEMLKSDDSCISSMANKMQQKFNKYWKKCNILFAIALVLDPRYKLEYVEFMYHELYSYSDADEYTQVLRKEMVALFNEYTSFSSSLQKQVITSTSTEMMNDTSTDSKKEQLRKSFLRKGAGKNNVDLKTELEQYYEEKICPDDPNLDILSWWKVNSSKFPILSTMARDILAIQVSTVASESAFNTGSRVINQYRSSLSPGVIQALVCTQDWLRDVITDDVVEGEPEVYDHEDDTDRIESGVTEVEENEM